MNNTFEIALRSNTLPEKLEELVPMVFAGNAAVSFMAAKLKAINEVSVKNPGKLLEQQRQKTIADGQAMGEMLIKIMAKIGEMAEQDDRRGGDMKSPSAKSNLRSDRKLDTGDKAKAERMGLKNANQLRAARTIHKNPDVVAKAIKESKELEDIPNVGMIVQKVQHAKQVAKMQERIRQNEDKKTMARISLEEERYVHALEKAFMAIPSSPPKNWTEQGLTKAVAVVLRINKRLAHFNDAINKKGELKHG